MGWQVKASAAFSRDGGLNWTTAQGVAPSDYRVSGDVSVTFDAQGHAVLCYIAFDKLGTTNYWGHNATRNGVFIRRSLDGGEHWEANAIPVLAHPSEPGIPFEDKPYIVADNTQSPHRGNLYVGWTEFSLTKSIILFSRSTDGGQSWSKPLEISSHAGLPRDDNGSVEGFTGTVAPDGTLYVVWADGNDIAFTCSRDGGRTFARSRSIIHTAPPYFQVEGVSRANGFPQIAWGPTPMFAASRLGGPPFSAMPKGWNSRTALGPLKPFFALSGNPHSSSSTQDVIAVAQRRLESEKVLPKRDAGLLYITWSDYRHGDVDVFCATSNDGGQHWSPPVRVNSDPLHNGRDQFFQWLALDPADGSANVVFYDRREDPANRKTVVVLARSIDGGTTFQNYAWTEQPFESRDDFLGDYTAIVALNGRVYAAWAEVQVPGPSNTESAKPPEPPGVTEPEQPAPLQIPPKPPDQETAGPKHRTVLRLGIADFSPQNK